MRAERSDQVLLGGLVAEDTGGQHDVAGPAAGAAEADEHAVRPGPVLADKALPAVGQRQGRRAPRAVPGCVAPVPSASKGNQPRPTSPPAVTPLPGGATERAAVTRPRPSGSRAP